LLVIIENAWFLWNARYSTCSINEKELTITLKQACRAPFGYSEEGNLPSLDHTNDGCKTSKIALYKSQNKISHKVLSYVPLFPNKTLP